ncbi:choice-of-anchor I family protein [Motiliproteus sp.]|uniref:choice-of-anchor I family protein n=1 Tax=Motiliproteus sp. TaxID=1898955 RepID=UPI003BA8EFCC
MNKTMLAVAIAASTTLAASAPWVQAQGHQGSDLKAAQYTLNQSLGKAQFSAAGKVGKSLDISVGFGSGAFHDPKDPANQFYAVTDRGPNIKCKDSAKLLGIADFCGAGEGAHKIFPMPSYTPMISKFEIDSDGVKVIQQIPLRNSAGEKITGLSNELTVTNTEKSYANTGEQRAFDSEGVDTEALIKLSDGSFWLADEYGPSLIHVAPDGTILERVVPAGMETDLADAGYPVSGKLPAVYAKRKLNRGMESVAVSPDERSLYFIMQSPLANPNAAAYKSSRNVRLMKFGLNNGELGKAQGEWIYQIDTPAMFADLPSGKGDLKKGQIRKQSDVKISEMVAVGNDDLIILERISKVTKLYRVQLSSGDSILDSELSRGAVAVRDSEAKQTLEQIYDPGAVGAMPLVKALVFNSLTDLPKGMSLATKIEGIALLDDQHVALINDNDFGIDGKPTQVSVLPIMPKLVAKQSKLEQRLSASLIGRHTTGIYDESAAEIVSYHPRSKRAFVVNAEEKQIDVIDLSKLNGKPLADPLRDSNLTRVGSLNIGADLKSNRFGAANSVAVGADLVAVAVEAADIAGNKKQGRGVVAFYDARSLKFLKAVRVGALPDMVTFTPDNSKLLVANEGEPSKDYRVDPVGSVSVIQIRKGRPADVATELRFDQLHSEGIRTFGPGADFAQDLEPEYIAVSDDSSTAWVSLQENNALAMIDLKAMQISKVVDLGLKDYGRAGNELDVSDKDKKIDIRARKGVVGMYQPDTIAAYRADGHNYVVTANEGDARDYWFDAADEASCLAAGGREFDAEDGCLAFSEETRIAKLDIPATHPSAAEAADKKSLGRMKTTRYGYGDESLIYTYGARSFSIWNEQGELVFDSQADIEKITAARLGKNFNNTDNKNKGDNRSDDKGAEPEALAVGQVNGRTYAFVGLERTGGFMIYDITNPYGVVCHDYVINRNFDSNPKKDLGDAGDLAPEGMKFVSAEQSLTGKALLIVGHEVSGSTAVYQLQ